MSEQTYVLRTPEIRKRVAEIAMQIGAEKKLWQVTFAPFVKTRTTNRNSMLHALWGEFAKELGWTKDEAKEWFKETHGPKIEKVIGDEVFYIVKPSSKYTTPEAEAMCESIYRIAAEHGVAMTVRNIGEKT